MNKVTILLLAIIATCTIHAQTSFVDYYSNGLDLMKAQKFEQAIESFEQAYQLAPDKIQERSKALWAKGMALYRIAQDLNMAQNYQEAYAKYGEAMKLFRRVKRDKDVMDCAYSMATLNDLHFGFYNLAIEQYNYALTISQKLNLLDKQIEILEDIIKIDHKVHNEHDANVYAVKLDSVMAVANQYPEFAVKQRIKRGDNARLNGEYDVAISFYTEALSSANKPNEFFSIYQKLRDTYAFKGDYDNTLVFSKKCIENWMEEFKDNPSQKYLIYRNHYPYQIKAGDISGALSSLDSIQKSLELDGSKIALGDLYMDRARIYSGIGNWQEAVMNYHVADSLFLKSTNIAAVIERQKQLIPLYASALYQNNEYEKSGEQFNRNLELVESCYGTKSMEYSQALCYLANIEGYLDQLDDGAKHYIDSWQIARDITMQDLQMLPSNARGKYWQDINSIMWNMVPYALAAKYRENEFLLSAYEALVFSKGLLLAVEKTTGDKVQSLGNKTLIADFMAVANLRNNIERQRSIGNGAEIMRLYAKMDSLDRILNVNMTTHGISPSIQSVSASAIISSLDKSEAVIDFADFIKKDGTHIYVAFVVKPGIKHPRLIKVFEQSWLDSLLADNNGKYSDLYNDYNYRAMYEIIWKPLMKELKGVRTIYFVPSGILNQIAVEAVQIPDGEYIGDKYNIVRLSNSKEVLSYKNHRSLNNFADARLYGGLKYDVASDIMVSQASAYKLPPLLAVRGGTDSIKAQSGFDELKKSAEEVIEISDLLSHNGITVTKLMATEGTEESFVSMSGNSPDLLLVSTHGFYYSPENVPSWSSLNGYDNPMYLTGLVMSGGNAEYLKREIPEGVMGGLLTSSDIAGLDLSGTQLVVLSACETGLGETTNEGVYGLQRAFKKAGAQTLVLSLWPVSDMATKDFMTMFHLELAKNKWDKRTAFANARQSLRKRYDNPYYWAAFIMID